MRESKREKITFIFTLACEHTHKEVIKGFEAQVTYVFRMYFGPTKAQGIHKGTRELVEVKGYGLTVTRSLEFFEPITPGLAVHLRRKGYKIIDGVTVANCTKDFGFLSAQNYEVNYLIQKLDKSEFLSDWDQLTKHIHEEVAKWGETVIDVTGRTVYENGKEKRDPFAKAAKLALKRKLNAQRNALKSNQNPLPDETNNGKGAE